MPEGFAGGFLGGLQTVGGVLSDMDRAQAEREKLAAEKERLGAEQQNADRAFGLQTQQFQANKEHQDRAFGLQKDQIEYGKTQDVLKNEREDKKLTAEADHLKNSDSADRIRADAAATSAAANAEANRAQAQYYGVHAGLLKSQKAATDWKTSQEQIQQERQDAATLLKGLYSPDGKLNIPQGAETDVYRALQTIGIPVDSIAGGDKQYWDDIQKVKGIMALDDHDARMSHPEANDALESFNRLFRGQINANVGTAYSGQNQKLLDKGAVVADKKVIMVQPTRKDDGSHGSKYHFILQESYVDKNGKPIVGKDGKPVTEDGPVSWGRNDDRKAPIREVSIPEMIDATNAHQKLYDMLQKSPELRNQVQQIGNYVLGNGKAKSENVGKWDDTGEETNDKGERLYHNDTTNELRWVAPGQAPLSPEKAGMADKLAYQLKTSADKTAQPASQQSLPPNAEGSSTYQIRTKYGELVDVNDPNISTPYNSVRH